MPLIIAHRGASRAERENTLAAFRAARRLGADMVELDVRVTADGALAVHHDAWLSDRRAVASLWADDLPEHVPLLADALDACEGMGVNIEIKNEPDEPGYDPDAGVADAVVAEARARGELDRMLISSFDLETIDRVHAIEPGLGTAWLVIAVGETTLSTLTEHGHSTIHPWHGSTTAELVARCRRAGIVVNVWTTDDPARIRELSGWGVAGICTNVPDLARAALEA